MLAPALGDVCRAMSRCYSSFSMSQAPWSTRTTDDAVIDGAVKQYVFLNGKASISAGYSFDRSFPM